MPGKISFLGLVCAIHFYWNQWNAAYLVDVTRRRHLHHLLLLVVAQRPHQLHWVHRLVGARVFHTWLVHWQFGTEGKWTVGDHAPSEISLSLPVKRLIDSSVNVPWWRSSPSDCGCARPLSSARPSGSSGRGWGRTLRQHSFLAQPLILAWQFCSFRFLPAAKLSRLMRNFPGKEKCVPNL